MIIIKAAISPKLVLVLSSAIIGIGPGWGKSESPLRPAQWQSRDSLNLPLPPPLGYKDSTMRFETRAVHQGQGPDPATGAVVPPIQQSSAYVIESYRDLLEEKGRYIYSRIDNPNRAGLEETLISPPALMSHRHLLREERLRRGIKDNLIRASVGIEHVDDLIADLEEALTSA